MTHCFVRLYINSRGEDIEEDRPYGAESEQRQSYKTLNTDSQKRNQADKCRIDLSRKYNEAVVEQNIILNILERNKAVESGIELRTTTKYLVDDTVEYFLQLIPA